MIGLVVIGVGVARDQRGDPPVPSPGISPSSTRAPLDGVRIALDPGHNGANADHPAVINALVPDGRGGSKACNTTGTATAGGYPEHAFTWDVAQRTQVRLTGLGATVLLTRGSDQGVGPCVDERGTFGQDNRADAVVSIHADGSDDVTLQGYFAIVADPPLHDSQGEPSLALARALLDALGDQGFTRSPAYAQGLSLRPDLAGLNHARVPAVILELGEMRNPEEAGVMETPEGRERYAEAIVRGVLAWVESSG